MFYILFALFMAFASPAHHTKKNCHDTVTTLGDAGSDDDDDTGGDGGHIDPKP